MRLALIVVYFTPSKTSAAVQMGDLAHKLLALGHDVLVITPSHKIHKNWEWTQWKSIEILRLRSFPVKGTPFFKRAIHESLLPISMIYRFLQSSKRQQRFDGIVWYSPSIFFGLFVLFLKLRSKCKAYLILRDIFPEWAKDLGLINNYLSYKYFKMVASFQYWVADTIGIQSNSNIQYFTKWKKNGKRIEVLNNWLLKKPILSTKINIQSTPLYGKKIFAFVGTMGVAQNLEILLDLAHKLQCRNDIGFLFLGDGDRADPLRKMARLKKLKNTLFHKEIESEEIPAVLAQCAVGLIALDPRHKTHNIPGKFLAYLSAGLPILARINPNSDLEKIIRNKKIGFVHTGCDLDVMAIHARKLIDDSTMYLQMRKNALKLFRDQYTPTKAAEQIVYALST